MSLQWHKVWQAAGRAGGAARHAVASHPKTTLGATAAVVAATGVAWYLVARRQPTAEELERRRREFLTQIGRLTDGSIVDARTLDGEESYSATADVLLYRYRIAGVTYECAQDVSALAETTRGYRIDQPVQVRYDAHNPGNSIIVSEAWSGLRSLPERRAHDAEANALNP